MQIKDIDIQSANAVLFGCSFGATVVSGSKLLDGSTTGGLFSLNVIATTILGALFAWRYWRHRAQLKALLESNAAPVQGKPAVSAG
jgi:uncharacterized membrane protein (UPF0136 family)